MCAFTLSLPWGEEHSDAAVVRPLLAWYDKNARVLPWRGNPTPYRVWISEVMLQQTRVAAALPYFQRFVAQLPDAASLAAADEDVLLKLWEGLGYYSRVRNLQKAARVILARFGGEMPRSYEDLLTLPGVGDYTAGAIASIAYNLPVPAVDGNVLRVLARLAASREEVSKPQVKAAFRRAVRFMLPERAGDFNQALMEIGATVCLPGAALRCGGCPLRGACAGCAQKIADSLPVKAPKKARRQEKRTVLLLFSQSGVLLHRRPPKGLLAGMWELPCAEGWIEEEQAARFAVSLGARAPRWRPLGGARHIFSHVEWQMRGLAADVPAFLPPEGYAWADARALAEDYALPSAFGAYMDYIRSRPEFVPARKNAGSSQNRA